jgi:hypothetical protein
VSSEDDTQILPPRRRRTAFRPVDVIALVLAVGLVLIAAEIGLALVINVVKGHNPQPTLGENTTQVLIGVMGGLIGVLGSYLGYSVIAERGGA